jgi:hypothetical protein
LRSEFKIALADRGIHPSRRRDRHHWPVPEELDDEALKRKLFAPAPYNPPRSKPLPEWGHIQKRH